MIVLTGVVLVSLGAVCWMIVTHISEMKRVLIKNQTAFVTNQNVILVKQDAIMAKLIEIKNR